MSQRLKRQQSRVDDASVPSKRRKGRSSPRIDDDDAPPPSSVTCPVSSAHDGSGEEMEDGSGGPSGSGGAIWTPRTQSDLKISSIYNRSAPEAPAEVRRTQSPLTDLFRKDLISAMKLPDSEPLAADEYWLISDPWKQEWERGVQVPVNPDSLPEPSVTVISQAERSRLAEFKLPKGKYLRITGGDGFCTETHHLSNVPTESERACAYDLDDCDLAWLNNLNGERALMGLGAVREDQLERVLEEMEVRCWKKIQSIVRSEEGLGIEYDENVICDVCRSPDSEEGNEMVFCDCCNICVHQACYGITTIPAGSWLCRTCALSQRPECVLCPNRGGAMKCTRSGHKWAHVSCALWIPEVSIGCVERMEPITKISSIPQSRWALICVLCRERVGACIQCSVKTCKTAYHVTCAFKHGLEMRAIIEDESADDGVKLRSYCQKHSVTSKKEKMASSHLGGVNSGSEDDEGRRRKRKDMTSEERCQAKAAKLQEIEAEFDKHMTLKDLPPQHLDLDQEAVTFIYNYWKLKRKAGGNRPLIAPRTDDIDMLSRAQVQADQEKMRMFVQLRQDLERVRNLCYMVSRREKLSRSFFRIREQTFHKQVSVITTLGSSLAEDDAAAIIQANHGPSIYDRLYSHDIQEPFPEIDDLVSRISGVHDSNKKVVTSSTTSPLNGLLKRPPTSPIDANNPYKRTYFNGASTRRRGSSVYSMSSESDSDLHNRHSKALTSGSRMLGIRSDSSADESTITALTSSKQQQSSIPSSNKKQKSSDDNKPSSLRRMERELTDQSSITGDSSSDELMALPKTASGTTAGSRIKAIYSDSDDEDQDRKGETSRALFMRTKAAVKEFTPTSAQQGKKDKVPSPNGKTVRGRKPKRKVIGEDKKPIAETTEMIVPQRQAAKKASESIRHSTVRTKEPGGTAVETEVTTKSSPEEKEQAPPSRKKNKKDNRGSADIYDFEKELMDDPIAYVPQRQAAKKAAEHIKGLGKPGETPAAGTELLDGKKVPKSEPTSKKPVKTSSTLSSSESDDDDALEKAKRIKSTVFGKVRAEKEGRGVTSNIPDRPFLDKEVEPGSDEESPSKPTSTKQKRENDAVFRRRASHESSSASRNKDKEININKPSSSVPSSQSIINTSTESIGSNRKPKQAPSKKLKTSDRRPDSKFQQPPNTSSTNNTTITNKSNTSSSIDTSRTAVTSATTIRKKSSQQSSVTTATPRSPTSSKDRVSAAAGRDRPPRRSTSSSSSSSTASSGSSSSGSSSSGSSSSSSGSSSSGSSSDSSSSSDSEDTKRTAGAKESSLKNVNPPSTVSATTTGTPAKSHQSQQQRRSTPRRQEITPTAAAISSTPSKSTEITKSKSSITTPSGPRKSINDDDIKKTNKTETSERKQSIDTEVKKTSPKKSVDSRRKSAAKDTTTPTKKAARESSTESIKTPKGKHVSPPREMVSPRRRPSATPRSGDVVSKKVETPPKRGENVLKKGETTPKRQETPKRGEATPKREATPRRSETPRRESSTPRREPTPRRDSTPRRRESTKTKDDIIEFKPESEEVKHDETKRSKPMPKCKKKDLGLLTDGDITEIETPVVKSPPVTSAKKPTDSVIAPEEPLLLPSSSPSRVLSPQAVPIAQQRSIFSPPHQKDQEILDFEREILAVDETMGRAAAESSDLVSGNVSSTSTDDARNSMPPPLLFSFGSECLFKEDSKEDSARETLNLVEKLRLEYAKKSVPDSEPGDDLPPPTPTPVMEKPKEEEEEIEIQQQQAPMPKPNSPQPAMAYNAMEVKVGPPERDKLDQTHGAQADERWVPPSPVTAIPPPLQSPLPVSAIPELQQQMASIPELPPSTPSEYMARKWAESEMIPSRRSSSSSGSSTASSSSHRDDIPPHMPSVLPPTPLAELTGYGMGLSGPEAASLFYGTHLFPPPGMDPNSYPLFPPYSLPPPAPPFSALLPSQLEEAACSGAAFTSSQHNMALTAALMSPGAQNASPFAQMHMPHQPQPSPVPSEPPPQTPPNFIHAHPPFPSPLQEPSTPSTPLPCSVSEPPTPPPPPPPPVVNHKPPTPAKQVDFVTPPPPPANNTHPGKKSPSKPTRSSTRVIPKPPTPKPVAAQSPRPREKKQNRGGYGARGRGKGRGGKGVARFISKGPQLPNKLQGTVYDFDDDDFDAPPTPGVENLRAMRERRRSTDVHKFEEAAYNDSRSDEGSFTASSPPPQHSGRNFPDVVQPVLPGPVDMRTYSGGSYTSPAAIVCNTEIPTPTSSAIPEGTLENQNQLLGSFANAEPHPVPDFVEDLEKELHSALEASRPERIPSPKLQQTTSVTLQESRNQLKFKIKGPFYDANYASATPVVPPTVSGDPSVATGSGAGVTCLSQVASTASSGPSNLRRMRKKELLRQYWTQDMNMEEGNVTNALGSPTPVAAAATATPVSRAIIIPKAVASMTSIPTREDYKAVVDANMEKKRRKGGMMSSDDMDASQASLAFAAAQKKRGRPKVQLQIIPQVTQVATATAAPKLKIRLGASPSAESEDRRLLRVRPPKKRLSATVQIPTIEELRRESMKFRKKIMADFDSQEPRQKTKSEKKSKKQRGGGGVVVNEKELCVVVDPSCSSKNIESGANNLNTSIITNNPNSSNISSSSSISSNISSTPVVGNNEEKSAPKLIIRLGKRPGGSNINKSSSTNTSLPLSTTNTPTPPPPKSASDCVPTPPPSSEERLSGSEQTPTNNNNNNSSSTTPTPPSSQQENLLKKQPSTSSLVTPEGSSETLLKVRTSKVTPIRLKLSRCEEGYVMASKQQQQQQQESEDNSSKTERDNNELTTQETTPTVPVPQGCEVR